MTSQLGSRAQEWLATLERQPPVSTEEVERSLRAAGVVPYAPWLEFHEQFAGFVEPLGSERAVWGLAHRDSTWMRPGKVVVEQDHETSLWNVTCADVHPSYGYLLDENGGFDVGPARTFAVYVERCALRWWFCAQDGELAVDLNVKSRKAVERIEGATSLVEEASDQHLEYHLGPGLLAIRHPDEVRWVEVFSKPQNPAPAS